MVVINHYVLSVADSLSAIVGLVSKRNTTHSSCCASMKMIAARFFFKLYAVLTVVLRVMYVLPVKSQCVGDATPKLRG